MNSTLSTGLAFDGEAGLVLALAIIVSLLVGSFLNVVIHRLPKMMERDWHRDCCELLQTPPQAETSGTYNLLKPDSHCPGCQTPIKPWQNIPIVSFLLLRGKCANCKTPISWRYPLIEFTTALLSGFIIWQWGFTPQALAAVGLTWALICLTMIDIDTQLLPDSITLPLLWAGLILNSGALFNDQALFTSLDSALWGAVAGYMILWSVFWLFKLITGKEGMGYGDFKLLAALGAWLGWQALPLIIILSSFVGAIIGVVGIIILGRNKNIPIPFGPYLAIAGWIALLWGDSITASYLQFAGVQ